MTVKNRILKLLTLWFIMGAMYMVIEGLWRGWTHISMLAVGGLCGLAVGSINQIPRFYNMPVILQSLIGAIFVLITEFCAGCMLNLWLGLGIWDYSHLPLNLCGQVCPLYGLLWVGLMPFAIWLEDALRWKLWGEGEYYGVIAIYKEFVTGR